MDLKCDDVISAGTTAAEQTALWYRQNSSVYAKNLQKILQSFVRINSALNRIKNQRSGNPDLYQLLVAQQLGPIDPNAYIAINNTNDIYFEETINNQFTPNEFTSISGDGIARVYFLYNGFIRTQISTLNTSGTTSVLEPDDAKIGSFLGRSNYTSTSSTKKAFRELGAALTDLKAAINILAPLHQKYSQIPICFNLLNKGLLDSSGNPISQGTTTAPTVESLANAENLLNSNFGDETAFGSDLAFPAIDRINFKEQCFLLANIFHLTEIKERIDHGVSNILPPSLLGYKELPDMLINQNRTVLVNGEPFGIVNSLTQSPYKEKFFEMTNEQISTLIPMLRFYKVVPLEEGEQKQNGCQEKEVEIVFDTYDLEGDLRKMFSPNPGMRGIGVGVESFNFAYEADNPFAIKKAISAKLTIHANNFSELTRPRYNSTQEYRYIDLALHTVSPETVSLRGAGSQVHTSNLNKLNFRLKVVMGWTVPPSSRGLFDSGLLDAIYDSSITLNLTPTVHMFDVDDAGVVKFTIDYLAYTQEYFDNASFNIFTDKEVFVDNIVREIAIKALNAKIKVDGDGSSAAEEKKDFLKNIQDTNVIANEKEKSLKSLISEFINYGRIYYTMFDRYDAALYGLNSPYSYAAQRYPTVTDLENEIRYAYNPRTNGLTTGISTNIENQLNAAANQIQQQSGGTSAGSTFAERLARIRQTFSTPVPEPTLADIVPPPNKRIITFFYASDLIDLILDNIEKSLRYIHNVTLSRVLAEVSNVDSAVVNCLISEEFQKYVRLYDNFLKLRIMLGPMEIQNPDENSFEYKVRNIGDTPVSMKNFLEFLTTKMINLEKPQYYLTQFINDFFNEFVVNLMNRDLCYGGKAAQRIFLHENTFTEYRNDIDDDDTITKYCNNPNIGINPEFQVKCPGSNDFTCTKRLYLDIKPPVLPIDLPILNVMGVRNDPRPSADLCLEYNYIFFYAGRAIPMNQMVGCKKPTRNSSGDTGCFNSKGNKVSDTGDHSRGIWHYQIGKNRGIVKTINLSKTDSTGLAEVRYEQEGYDGLKQLRVLYDVTIKSFLDISAFPGSYIYVEPRGFDIASGMPDGLDLTQLGIGGYHMIYKSEHTISPGVAETTIYAKWVASNAPSEEITPPISQTGRPSKCGN